jgi:hypothetical protein
MMLEQLQREYWDLTDEALALAREVIDDWHTSSVQLMRKRNKRMNEINARLLTIRELKSYTPPLPKKSSDVRVRNPRTGQRLDTKQAG